MLQLQLQQLEYHLDYIEFPPKKFPSSKFQYPTEVIPSFTEGLVNVASTISNFVIGCGASKRFNDGIYVCTIFGTWTDDFQHKYWTAQYGDNDHPTFSPLLYRLSLCHDLLLTQIEG